MNLDAQIIYGVKNIQTKEVCRYLTLVHGTCLAALRVPVRFCSSKIFFTIREILSFFKLKISQTLIKGPDNNFPYFPQEEGR